MFQVCGEGHVSHVWCAQPVTKFKMHVGDILAAAAVVVSGNNYAKMAFLAQTLNLKFVSKTTFAHVQANSVVPVVDEKWKDHQREVADSLKEQLVLLGKHNCLSSSDCLVTR